ncbi:MAG: cobalt transporter CbiM [Methermicoccaceae archaeon]
MVHISDGVLSFPVLAAGWGITLVIMGLTFWWSKKKGSIAEQIPRLSVMTGAFFVASLIHVPVGPTSVHLILSGLVGVVLGVLSYPAIFIGLVLQAFLFQHGGITTLGINTVNMGVPALVAYAIFRTGRRFTFLRKGVSEWMFGALAGGLAVFLSVLLLAASLVMTGEEFFTVAWAVALAHIPIMVIEAVVTGSVVAFLAKVKPELIAMDTEGARQ